MGIFSKRVVEPLVHPEVARIVHVRARATDVIAHLDVYSGLWSRRRAEEHQVEIGEVDGWTAIRLPRSVHPWQLHNMAFWMLDCPATDHARPPADSTSLDSSEVIAESAASPDHAGYRLVRDPAVDDALCGWDDDGVGWTVHVPGNDVVRGEDVPVPRSLPVPSGHRDWRWIGVLLEDPGRGMNERNEPTMPTRARLTERTTFIY